MRLEKCTCKNPKTSQLHTGNKLARNNHVNYICLGCNAHRYGPPDNPREFSGKEWEEYVNV